MVEVPSSGFTCWTFEAPLLLLAVLSAFLAHLPTASTTTMEKSMTQRYKGWGEGRLRNIANQVHLRVGLEHRYGKRSVLTCRCRLDGMVSLTRAFKDGL